MSEMRILSPTGILGYGFPRESFDRGMRRGVDLIGVDAGSTDPGPAYLGSGKCFVDPDSVARDVEILALAALDAGVPLVVGTAGGSGARTHVEGFLDILDGVLRKHGRSARVAIVYSDVPPELVRERLDARRVQPLPFVPDMTREAIASCERIVAQIGVQALLPAWDEPVDIVVAGRCYDPAVYAAVPLRRGFDLGLALHMGKILECGAIAATPGSGRDCVVGVLREDCFLLESLNPMRRFTVDSVAAHTLYEKSHPYLLPGPGGTLDLSDCEFRQATAETVEVRGSRFVPSDQRALKIEGAARVGYRTIAVAGARDATMIASLDEVFDGVREAVESNFGAREYRLNFRVYGRDGVMGPREPTPDDIGHEVGIVFDAVAPTQQEADTICGFARSTALHYGYEGRITTAGNLAFPFSPSDIPAGPVYEFRVYHLMEVDDPPSLFPVERATYGAKR